jgi:hypothetical protein
MKRSKTVVVLSDEFEAKEFFDIVGTSTELSGVEISSNGTHIGSILGLFVPDENDFETEKEYNKALKMFDYNVEMWLFDNYY